MGEGNFIIDDANNPAVEGGYYVIAYGEMVDGYRHAYAETNKFGRKKIRYSRSSNHPEDSRCPECALVSKKEVTY